MTEYVRELTRRVTVRNRKQLQINIIAILLVFSAK